MIGVFDSGFGGLTILRALVSRMSDYSYLYLADNAHAPYGQKTTSEVTELTKAGVDTLFQNGAGLVVLACNTASAAALRTLQQAWLPSAYPDRRLLGIVVPTVEQITGADWRHETPITTPISPDVLTVGILATPATVAAAAYPHEIHKRNQSLRVVQQACPDLVALIEQSAPKTIVRQQVEKYVTQLVGQAQGSLHAVLLGCTHFELIASLIASELPPGVRLYHQPSIVAASLAHYVRRHKSLAATLARGRERIFLTTGNPADVSTTAARYLGESAAFQTLLK